VRERIQNVELAVQRFGGRLDYVGYRDRKYLALDARAYLKNISMLKRIGLLDLNNRVIWSYPENISSQVLGFDHGEDEVRRAAIARSLRQGAPVMSGLIPLKSGGMGFVIYSQFSYRGRAAGFVYATLQADRLFANLEDVQGMQFLIRDHGHPAYSVGWLQSATDSTKATSLQLASGNAQLEFVTKPSENFIHENQTFLPWAVFFGGGAIALLLGSVLQARALSRRTEMELAASEAVFGARLNFALKSASIGVWTLDFATQDIWRSENHDQIYGHSTALAQWGEKEFFEHVLPEDLPRVTDGLQRRMSSIDPVAIEYRIFCGPERQIRWLRMVTQTHSAADGTLKQVSGCVYDVTEEKRKQEDLSIAHDRLTRVIEATEEGILELDYPVTYIAFIDSIGKRIFNVAAEEPFTLAEMRNRIVEDDRLRSQAILNDHVVRGTERFELEFRVRSEEVGNERWARVRGKIMNGKYVATIGDITEEVKIRERLKDALNKAEAGTAAKSAFLANISHEIRTPLNGIVGMCGFLMDTPLESQQRDYVENLRTNADILLGVINDVLDISKIEAGKLDLEFVEFDLAGTISALMKAMNFAASQKSIHMRAKGLEAILYQYWGDPVRFRQILTNLISNAIKFTNVGEITVEIERRAEGPEWTTFRFSIHDEGIGIAAEKLQNLFKPFSQADASTTRRFGGSGLGLSICKQLVELYGGEIGVHSREGEGSTFWFEIGLRKATLLSAVQAQERQLTPEVFRDTRILVAEDNQFNQVVMTKHLEKFSIRADVVSNGREALAALEARNYDLVMMDCNMPEMDGFEATKVIRTWERDGKIAKVPVIATTANAFKESRDECLAAGMDDYLPKPIHVADLRRILLRWLKVSLVSTPPSADEASEVPLNAALSELAGLQIPGEPDLISELIESFMRQGREGLNNIEAAMHVQDMVSVVNEMHRFKSSSRTLGGIAFGNLCEAIERLASSGKIADLRVKYINFPAEYRKFAAELESIRAGRKPAA
jgi:signal transduction histidine kinase/CheY-like chemotaxis protein